MRKYFPGVDPDFSVRGGATVKAETLIKEENLLVHYTVGKNKD